MHDSDILEVLERAAERRTARRQFLRFAGAAGVAATLAACDDNDDEPGGTATPSPTPTPSPTATPTPTPTTVQGDIDVLNFALNLEYLEAQFYQYAATGSGLPSSLTGVTTAPTGSNFTGARGVSFSDQAVAAYAREIATDEANHVRFLRTTLGGSAVNQPALDIGVGPNTAFSNAARSAGLIGAGATFDPYSSDEFFLLGAYIFEDVGVTAYKGASPLVTNKTYLEAAAGILAAEAYHAGLIRTILYRKGVTTALLRTGADAISDARDRLDGSDDRDQGISPTGTGATTTANIVPTNDQAIAYSRSAAQVLNIVYLNPAAVSAGGFFPAGVNGNLRTSAAS
jgi:hypothetical protein